MSSFTDYGYISFLHHWMQKYFPMTLIKLCSFGMSYSVVRNKLLASFQALPSPYKNIIVK